jgi:dTDP-4-amino-4,6-dideoxygalactose transaminase
LKSLSKFKARRQEIVKAYNEAFSDLEAQRVVVLPPWPADTDPCYHIYPLRLGPNGNIDRDELFHRLREKRIHCQIHYIPIYRQPFYQERYGYSMEDFVNAEEYFASCISLPLFAGMARETILYVVETLTSLIKSGDSRVI